MIIWSQTFDFDKSIMLNVLYDTLEALNLDIEKADSDKGEITISTSKPKRKVHRIHISVDPVPLGEGKKTEIIASSESDHNEVRDWMAALQDEIQGTLSRSNLL